MLPHVRSLGLVSCGAGHGPWAVGRGGPRHSHDEVRLPSLFIGRVVLRDAVPCRAPPTIILMLAGQPKGNNDAAMAAHAEGALQGLAGLGTDRAARALFLG